MADNVQPLDETGHKPIPPAIAYPADYGLASATDALVWQYGKDGAINRLIEMAERLEAGEKPGDWVFRRKRVDRTDKHGSNHAYPVKIHRS
jgi:hypothetical protein